MAGNLGGTPKFPAHAYDAATDFHLGNFGVDTFNHVAWAVVNHNSEFGVGALPDAIFMKLPSVTRRAGNDRGVDNGSFPHQQLALAQKRIVDLNSGNKCLFAVSTWVERTEAELDAPGLEQSHEAEVAKRAAGDTFRAREAGEDARDLSVAGNSIKMTAWYSVAPSPCASGVAWQDTTASRLCEQKLQTAVRIVRE